jgi:uncharacterized protein involved in outer membrane biogenesis
MNATASRPFRRLKILLVILLVLCLLGIAALKLGLHFIKGEIETALGPSGEVRELNLGLNGVEIVGLRLSAKHVSGGWPAENLLQAERITILPALGDLLGGRLVLRSVRVEGAYISLLRGKDGQMQMPYALAAPEFSPAGANIGGMIAVITRSLAARTWTAFAKGGLSRPNALANRIANMAAPAGQQEVRIEQLHVLGGTLEFFDAFVRQPAHGIRLENLELRLEHLQFPHFKGRSQLRLEGRVKGPRHSGKFHVVGWIEAARGDAELEIQANDVEFSALQAYLIRASESGMRQGRVNLELRSQILNGQLHAPGVLSLSHLELSEQSPTFMGMPQSLVNALLYSSQGRIDLKFTQKGNLYDPRFSLAESFTKTIGAAFADAATTHLNDMLKKLADNGAERGGETLLPSPPP